MKTSAVSARDLDTAKAALDRTNAILAAAEAAVAASRLNVEWCRVTAPIDGRISNKRVTEGNLVNGGAGQATLLTTDPQFASAPGRRETWTGLADRAQLCRSWGRFSPTMNAVSSIAGSTKVWIG